MGEAVFPPTSTGLDLPFSHALDRQGLRESVDLEAFCAGMRAVPGAVNIITTTWEGQRYGLTATAVCSLSAKPPRLLACVNQGGATFNAIRQSGFVAVNVTSDGQTDIAMRFAGMSGSDAEDRFAKGDWAEGSVGHLPVLSGACCSFQCRVAEIIDSVSHAIVIADIVDIITERPARPMVYCDGKFAAVDVHV